MKKEKRNYFNFALFGILLILSSCMHTKTVSRNYEFATDDTCDCYTKHPLILFGTKSNYYSKESAFCTRLNFAARKDSIIKLEELKYHLEDDLEAHSPGEGDSVLFRIQSIDKRLLGLRSDWTHSKIKTKWKNSSEGTIILKQKVKFYNRFKSGRKFVGMKKYKNGSLIKVKLEDQIQG
ncbi:hypothetical protein [Fluviicola sp.]|uniref:hypothetical protein n=1 Tax=Fluviicola sp. TaxID=1917219 RepID=UPI003D274A89